MFQISNRARTVRSRILLTTSLVAIYGLTTGSASATALQGQLGISSGPASNVTVTSNTISFGNQLFTVGNAPPNTGDFVPLVGTNGTIQNLNSSVGQQPTGSTFTYYNFLTFATNSAITFQLNYIAPGVFLETNCYVAAASGQTCTPNSLATSGVSPFNLSNGPIPPSSSTASFNVAGRVLNGANGINGISNFTGTFTTPFDGRTYQQVLAALQPGGAGFINSTYAATFTVNAVPEPAQLGLIGASLVGLMAMIRRRR